MTNSEKLIRHPQRHPGGETAMGPEMASQPLRGCVGQVELAQPPQSSSDMTRLSEGEFRLRRSPQMPQMPSVQPPQLPRTALQRAACPDASVEASAELSQLCEQARRYRAETRRLSGLRMRTGWQERARMLRRAAGLEALHRYCKQLWNSWKATWEVFLCLVAGESPETVKPCSPLVMRLYRLRIGGRI